MSEHLGSPNQSPTRGLARLYERWSAGGAGLLITGNVMIDPAHLEGVRNVAMKPESNVDRFREWAIAGTTHGNVVSRFLSPLTNQRSDRWGGSLEHRARFARTVLGEVRKAVGDDFPVSIKLNSADFQRGGFTEEESMRVLGMLQEDGVDLVEISGGSYESRVMLDKVESQREAFFLEYAKKARAEVDIPMMVTGGFRARSIMEDALSTGALDVVGMARPFTNNPSVAQDLIDGRTEWAEDPPVMPGLRRLGGMSEAMMSVAQMGLLAKGKSPTLRLGGLGAVFGSLVQETADLFRPKPR